MVSALQADGVSEEDREPVSIQRVFHGNAGLHLGRRDCEYAPAAGLLDEPKNDKRMNMNADNLNRREFLWRTAAGAAALGLAGVSPLARAASPAKKDFPKGK